jgi:mgtE-like transporter
MDYFKKVFKESIVIVVISSIMGVFSGTFLSINQKIIYAIPIILLILPSLNSLIGDICTVLTSRLTTHLYIGSIPPKVQKTKRLVEDFIGLLITILLSLLALLCLGFMIGTSVGINIINPFLIILIIILTILILFFCLFVFLFVSSIYLFKKGKDPNNLLIPFVTSLADFLTPLLLIIFIIIFI